LRTASATGVGEQAWARLVAPVLEVAVPSAQLEKLALDCGRVVWLRAFAPEDNLGLPFGGFEEPRHGLAVRTCQRL
jgi:hypothetical protein